MLFGNINNWSDYKSCVDQDSMPCWEAEALKGVRQTEKGEHSICCHYLNHNKHCNNQLHYCLDPKSNWAKEIHAETLLMKDDQSI